MKSTNLHIVGNRFISFTFANTEDHKLFKKQSVKCLFQYTEDDQSSNSNEQFLREQHKNSSILEKGLFLIPWQACNFSL